MCIKSITPRCFGVIYIYSQCNIFIKLIIIIVYTLTAFFDMRNHNSKTLYSMHCAYDARLQTKEGIGRKEMIAPDKVQENRNRELTEKLTLLRLSRKKHSLAAQISILLRHTIQCIVKFRFCTLGIRGKIYLIPVSVLNHFYHENKTSSSRLPSGQKNVLIFIPGK